MEDDPFLSAHTSLRNGCDWLKDLLPQGPALTAPENEEPKAAEILAQAVHHFDQALSTLEEFAFDAVCVGEDFSGETGTTPQPLYERRIVDQLAARLSQELSTLLQPVHALSRLDSLPAEPFEAITADFNARVRTFIEKNAGDRLAGDRAGREELAERCCY